MNRRDNCELVKDVVDTSLRNILIEGEPDKAISHTSPTHLPHISPSLPSTQAISHASPPHLPLPPQAISYVKRQISKLLMNEMDMGKLVISKALVGKNDRSQW